MRSDGILSENDTLHISTFIFQSMLNAYLSKGPLEQEKMDRIMRSSVDIAISMQKEVCEKVKRLNEERINKIKEEQGENFNPDEYRYFVD